MRKVGLMLGINAGKTVTRVRLNRIKLLDGIIN